VTGVKAISPIALNQALTIKTIQYEKVGFSRDTKKIFY
jgi:hypothetical protein